MYNGVFADAHKEEGKDIKAALTVEEMIALQLAYNNFDEDEFIETCYVDFDDALKTLVPIKLKLIDIVIEIVDSRAPSSSKNKFLEKLTKKLISAYERDSVG